MVSQYRQCVRCVMDETAQDIEFDGNGICNYCTEFLEKHGEILSEHDEIKKGELNSLVEKIKKEGKHKEYDCVVGVSGGVDSAYTLTKVKELGLRPLAVHMDNGWNSELAQNNIENIVRRLEVPLYTHVIDWNEYREFMNAFFDADVIDVELLYDNAMLAVNYEQARKYGIRYILAGSNTASEGLRIPPGWNWFKYDKKNMASIGKRFRNVKLRTLPTFGTLDYIWSRYFKKIAWVPLLDYMDYKKFLAMEYLKKEFDFKPYAYKHYESIFTRFYQGYILPKKFNVDKRKVHLSTLILTEQLTRAEALDTLSHIPYPNKHQEQEDLEYFLKKMNWNETDFKAYLSRKEKQHVVYGSEINLWNGLRRVLLFLRKLSTPN